MTNAPGQELAPKKVATAVTITEWTHQTQEITRMATDTMALPMITDGYALGGHPASLAYVHLNSMAMSRLKKHFPAIDQHDPLMARLIAEAKLIVAKCMLVKYECRARRQTYKHLDDITVKITKLVRDRLDVLTEEVRALTKD